MPPSTSSSAGAHSSDAFLTVTGKTQGVIKGECGVPGHKDEIDVITWQWGVDSPSAVGSTQATKRRIHEPLVVTKHLDAASTRLMSALTRNEELKAVKLALRKAGETDDYFTIELKAARVSNLHVQADPDGGVHEVVKFAFQQIEVTYRAQSTSGSLGGTQVFQDELSAAS